MAILYLHGTSIPETCWYILGLAVRAAQDVGIHRRKPTLEGGVPTIEDELSKRVFWVLIAIDTILCANVGRPRATGPFECVFSSGESYVSSSNSLLFLLFQL